MKIIRPVPGTTAYMNCPIQFHKIEQGIFCFILKNISSNRKYLLVQDNRAVFTEKLKNRGM